MNVSDLIEKRMLKKWIIYLILNHKDLFIYYQIFQYSNVLLTMPVSFAVIKFYSRFYRGKVRFIQVIIKLLISLLIIVSSFIL